MTMRELLDVLKTATPEEQLEFSVWWGLLPVPQYSPEVSTTTGGQKKKDSTP